MKKISFSKAVEKAEYYSDKLSQADSNLLYIKALNACWRWLKIADDNYNDETASDMDKVVYQQIFISGCGFSFYDRVNNSILDYKYGNRPF